MKHSSDKFAKAVGMAETSPANFEATHLIDRRPIEKRTRKAHTFLKPSEYEALINLIGRKTVSNIMRELVLDFIKSADEQN